jgi:hypothetical protein
LVCVFAGARNSFACRTVNGFELFSNIAYQMKRLIIAILAFLYMGTSMGATLHMHYCMGKLAGWGLVFSSSDRCPGCGMKKSLQKGKTCCGDEQKIIKNNSDQETSEPFFQAIYLLAAISANLIEAPAVHFVCVTEANPVYNTPPQSGSVAIYIRSCVFRI